jgi:fructose/tagatose bisphosphate aldolase
MEINDIQRPLAETRYKEELAAIAANDSEKKPEGWKISPQGVRTFILGSAKPLGLEGKKVAITQKFYGDDALVERAIVTLAGNRGLMLVGEPGTAKSMLSELLAAAISLNSANTIQGTAGTSEDGIKYTDPEQAADFVSRTRVSSLAIAIGTAHGFYNTVPILDLDLITATRKLVRVPLVMHGASGLSDETVSHAARLGMAKINFATELREAYTKTVRTYLSANHDAFDPKKFGEPARLAVKELVKRKIAACLSEGKA